MDDRLVAKKPKKERVSLGLVHQIRVNLLFGTSDRAWHTFKEDSGFRRILEQRHERLSNRQ